MKKILLVLLLVIALFGCEKEKEYSSDTGCWDNSTYTSEFFHFSITYPEGYSVYDERQMAQVLGMTLLELQEMSMNETTYEYMIAPELNSPLFQFYVEKYQFTIGVTYEDFLYNLVTQLGKEKEIYFAVGAIQDLTINDVEVKKIPLIAYAGFFMLKQDLYLFNEGTYVATIMVTYTDEMQQEVDDIIKTITFANAKCGTE